jgi:hypothetical protein
MFNQVVQGVWIIPALWKPQNQKTMKRETFNGKSINVYAMPTTVVCGLTPVCGTMFYIAENGEYSIGREGVFVQDLREIQNADVFMKGIKYIDKFACKTQRDICWDLLRKMQREEDKASQWYCRMIAFFCDLGLWDNKKLCQAEVWHKDFPKYLHNNMYNYYLI